MLQTLEQFLSRPFGKEEAKSNDYEKKYKLLTATKRVYMEACTAVDSSYLVHIKVGSESNAALWYDVVLMFFTADPAIKRDISFRRYYVKFFSNSPSFIYQYAVLYKQNGAMIDVLAEKMDQMYADKLPEKTNPSLRSSYDKSIYCACRFMVDHRVSAFSKAGYIARRKKRPENFFEDIKTFEDVKFTNELHNLEKKAEKQAKAEAKNPENKEKKDQTQKQKARKGLTVAKKIKAVKATTTHKPAKSSSMKNVKRAKTVKRK